MSVRPTQFMDYSRQSNNNIKSCYQKIISKENQDKNSDIQSCQSEKVVRKVSKPEIQNYQISQLQNQVFKLKSTINDLCIENKIQNINLIEEKKKNVNLVSQNKLLEQEIRKINIVHNQAQRQLQVLRKKLRPQEDHDHNIFKRLSKSQNSQIKMSSHEKQNLYRDLHKAQQTIKNLQFQVSSLKELNNALNNTICQQKNHEISNILQKNQQLVYQIKDELQRSLVSLEQYKAQAKLYKGRNDEMQERLQYYRRELQRLQEKDNPSQQQYLQKKEGQSQLRIKQQLFNKEIQLQQIQIQNNRLSNLLKTTEQRNLLKQVQLQQQIQLNNQFTSRLQVYERQYKQLQQLYFKQQRQLTKLALNSDHSTNKTQLTIRSLKSEVQLIKQQHTQQLIQKNNLINKLQHKLNVLQYASDAQSSKRKVDFLSKQLQILQSQNRNFKEAYQTLETQLQKIKLDYQTQTNKLKSQKKTLQQQLKKICNILENKSADQLNNIKNMSKIQQDYQHLKQKSKSIQIERDELIYEKGQLQDKFNKIQQKLIKTQDHIIKLSEQNSDYKIKNIQLTNKISIIQNLYSRLQSNYKKNVHEMDQKMTQVMNQTSQRSKSKNNNYHTNSMIYNFANDNDDMNSTKINERLSKTHNTQVSGFQKQCNNNTFNFGRKKEVSNNGMSSMAVGYLEEESESEFFDFRNKTQSVIQPRQTKERCKSININQNTNTKNFRKKIDQNARLTQTNSQNQKYNFGFDKTQTKKLQNFSQFEKSSYLNIYPQKQTSNIQQQTLTAVPTIKDLQSANYLKQNEQKFTKNGFNDNKYFEQEVGWGMPIQNSYRNSYRNSFRNSFNNSQYSKIVNKPLTPIEQLDPNENIDQKIKKIKIINHNLRSQDKQFYNTNSLFLNQSSRPSIQRQRVSPLTQRLD